MPPIQVECFIPPHGRSENITVDLDPETFLKAEKIMADGFVFQVEHLRLVGQVSWTIHNIEEEQDVAFNIVAEGTDTTEAVTKLIKEFDV